MGIWGIGQAEIVAFLPFFLLDQEVGDCRTSLLAKSNFPLSSLFLHRRQLSKYIPGHLHVLCLWPQFSLAEVIFSLTMSSLQAVSFFPPRLSLNICFSGSLRTGPDPIFCASLASFVTHGAWWSSLIDCKLFESRDHISCSPLCFQCFKKWCLTLVSVC